MTDHVLFLDVHRSCVFLSGHGTGTSQNGEVDDVRCHGERHLSVHSRWHRSIWFGWLNQVGVQVCLSVCGSDQVGAYCGRWSSPSSCRWWWPWPYIPGVDRVPCWSKCFEQLFFDFELSTSNDIHIFHPNPRPISIPSLQVIQVQESRIQDS